MPPVRRDPQPPKEEKPSTAQGVQHIEDDEDAEMETKEKQEATDKALAAERGADGNGEEEVFATGIAELNPADMEELEALAQEKLPSRNALTVFRDLLDQMIRRTPAPQPTGRARPLVEVAGDYPVLEDRTGGLDLKAAAKAADIDPEDMLDYAVRQRVDATGEPVGPKYLRYVTAQGRKEAVEL
jgi:hypothetical protein